MRIVTVVGARPQFIKAAPLSRALRALHEEILVHTGQHFDAEMSDVFFEELGIPAPAHHLGVAGGGHGAMVGRMLEGLERVFVAERPDLVVVFGDTNSTLAGALAASKLTIRLAHVEAGLRSFNRRMPEEVNRVVTDQLSDLLFCPNESAARHLAAEGITRGVHVVGDVMEEALRDAAERAGVHSTILDRLGLTERGFVLATVHRAENTDDPARLRGIMAALGVVGEPVVLPLHPRTVEAVERAGLAFEANVRVLPPLGHLDMVRLAGAARVIATDSGGLQKEAYWLGVPCVTMREETEWTETVDSGWNVIVGADRDRIADAVRAARPGVSRPRLHGDGNASAMIVARLST